MWWVSVRGVSVRGGGRHYFLGGTLSISVQGIGIRFLKRKKHMQNVC
jgi:hypothetical protein